MWARIKFKLSNKEGFFHNISILLFCNVAVNVIGLFTNMYIARTLQPEGYGEYGVVISWASILQIVSSLGIQQVAIRSIAQNRDASRYYFRISMIARFLGFAATCMLFGIYYKLFIDKPIFILLVILAQTLMTSVWDGIQNVAFGMQRMEYTGYINVIGQALLLGVYILLPHDYINLYNVIIIALILGGLKDVCYYIKCQKENMFRDDNSSVMVMGKKEVWSIIKESFPFYILAIFTLFTTQFPVLFLEKNAGASEVAYFNTANKLMVPMSMMLSTIMVALFPNLAKDASSNPIQFLAKIRKILAIVVPIGVVLCCLISLFRNEVVYIIYGEAYKSTGLVMSTQCWYIVLNFMFCLFGTVWAATKHDKLLSFISVFYAIINTPILWFSSKYGASSMSCGYVVGAIINMSYHYYFFLKTLDYKLSKFFSVEIFSLIGIGICFSFCFPITASLMLRIFVGLVIVAGFCLYLKKRYNEK